MLACTRLALHKGKDMNVIEVGDKFNCDCGFSWKRGQSGLHSCGDGLRKQIAELQQELVSVLAKGIELCDEAAHVYAAYNKEMAPDVVCDGQTIQEFHDLANGRSSVGAYLNEVRAEGIYFAANRMLAAWDSGFIDDTPAQAYDISGAVLSAVEFLPDASPEDFKRNFADSIRAEIAAKPRAETDTTPSQYESLAGGK